MQDSDVIIIGVVGRAFGIKGWVKINSFSFPLENIFTYSPLLLKTNNLTQTVEIEHYEIHNANLVAKFIGINDRNAAELITNSEIIIKKEQLESISDEDEYYWNNLTGLKIVNTKGIYLGIVVTIFNNKATDILVIKDNEKERMIPFIKQYILNIDLEKKEILVDWEEDF